MFHIAYVQISKECQKGLKNLPFIMVKCIGRSYVRWSRWTMIYILFHH